MVDNQVRNYALAKLAAETKQRTLKDVITEANTIVSAVEESTKTYFKQQGITITYLGLGGELGLSTAIQNSINSVYVAEQQQQVAKIQATTMAINAEAQRNAIELKGQADAKAMEELLKAVGGDLSNLGPALEAYRWDGSRLTVTLGPGTNTALTIPQPTQVPPPLITLGTPSKP